MTMIYSTQVAYSRQANYSLNQTRPDMIFSHLPIYLVYVTTGNTYTSGKYISSTLLIVAIHMITTLLFFFTLYQ